jgi:hypothetical protein
VAYVDALLESIQAKQQCVDAAESLADLAWDRLHTTNWRSVDERWRKLYGVAKLTWICEKFADHLCGSRALDSSFMDAVVRELDMVVIMSIGDIGDVAKKMIDTLESKFEALGDETLADERKNKRRKVGTSGSGGVLMPRFETPTAETPVLRNTRAIARVHCASLLDFETLYLQTSTPVIITGVATQWPALRERRWCRVDAQTRRCDFGYLRRVAGRRLVPVSVLRMCA